MFYLDGVLWDSPLYAIVEDRNTNEVLYRFPDISDVSIDISADTKDSVDKDGAIIKRSYTAKSATVTLTNTHLVLGGYAGTTGSKKIEIDQTNTNYPIPRMITVDSDKESVELADTPETGSVSVTPIYKDGGTGKTYKMSDGEAKADEYKLDGKTITFPTNVKDNNEIVQYLVKYEYLGKDTVIVENYANKFPKTVKLTIAGLYNNVCEDALCLGYIVFPRFQPSPETTLAMKNDSTFDYKGDAQNDYCSKKKRLFYMVFPKGDEVKDDED